MPQIIGLVEEYGPPPPSLRESTRFEAQARLAHTFGMSRQGLARLRSLVAERGQNSWQVGDTLVIVFGSPPLPGVTDGSRERLSALAEELDCSLSWLVATRICSAAWSQRERRLTVGWPIHRALAARPDRYRLLDSFVKSCAHRQETPTVSRLRVWLDRQSSDSPRHAADRSVGRPRQDAVAKVEKLALSLGRDELAELVARLTAALALAAA